jgi:hypothetical protein
MPRSRSQRANASNGDLVNTSPKAHITASITSFFDPQIPLFDVFVAQT